MPKIFISYRRADTRKDAGRIHDRLVDEFGDPDVFKDVDDIPIGSDFRKVLEDQVAECNVLLALIGNQWLNITDADGKRRLDNPSDFVRIEVESALRRDDCVVVPVLIDGAPMPTEAQLPGDLGQLAYKNAIVVRDDPDFNRDMDRLIRGLRRYDDAHGEVIDPNESADADPAPSSPLPALPDDAAHRNRRPQTHDACAQPPAPHRRPVSQHPRLHPPRFNNRSNRSVVGVVGSSVGG